MKLINILEKLKEPPKKFRPFVRWWWFGGGITKKEIAREMEMMDNQGIGGVEIQYLYEALEGSPLQHLDKIEWLSKDWVDLVRYAVKKGKELGLQIDLTFGNGWPFGGPHIDEKHASTKLASYSMPLGFQEEKLEIPLEDLVQSPEDIVCILAMELDEKNKLTGKSIDLSSFIVDRKDFGPTIVYDKPAENWVLYWYFSAPTRQHVKRAAPGGEGLVLDHLNRSAFQLHAKKIESALKKKFGKQYGKNFGAFFCDSWEVYGENWTSGFLQRFRDRCGYDLVPYLPMAIQPEGMSYDFSKDPAEDPRPVRYDYNKVHGELILEEFFSIFAEYCTKVGAKCRVQPYSAPIDLLRAYGLLDVLEIEGFGKHGIGTMYYGNVDPRLASSGAHVYDKSWVSCESFTWLGEHFSVSLEQLKREADQIILHGVHRIIYHGFPYSPPKVGTPGWVFYASIMANHNNTWWPYVGELNEYITRNAFIAQQGQFVADFAVYLPYHDEWCGKEETLKNLRKTLKGNGHLNDFDYINDERIQNASSWKNGRLEVSQMTYFGVVLCDVEYLPLQTAEKLLELVQQGMNIYVIGNFPRKSPGMVAKKRGEDRKVDQIFNNLRKEANSRSNICFLDAITEIYSTLEEQNLVADCTLKYLDGTLAEAFYIHYSFGDADAYFIVNEGPAKIINVSVRSEGSVWVLDLIENCFYLLSLNSGSGKNEGSYFSFPFDSEESKWFVVFKDNFKKWESVLTEDLRLKKQVRDSIKANPAKLSKTLELSWDIAFFQKENAFPKQENKTIEMRNVQLFDWSQKDQVQYFCGTAEYKATFYLKTDWVKSDMRLILDLGEVHEVAEVFLNGSKVKTSWAGNNRMNIQNFAIPGKNQLLIKVTNLLLNSVIGYEKQGLVWRPDYFFVNADYNDFKPEEMELLPSGLLGPLKLEIFGSPIQSPNPS